jgi:DNA polymerase I-like protein with 3'-5' exonuclease and polymerase domains
LLWHAYRSHECDLFAAIDNDLDLIGKEINLASPKQLQTVLFDELGMTGTKSLKTGFSTNAAALNELFELNGHPFLEKLLAHRDSTKLKQMVETLLKAVEDDSKIHTTYVQTGTSTGRLSSENPNLQNIPIRNPRGAQIRDSFIASAGFAGRPAREILTTSGLGSAAKAISRETGWPFSALILIRFSSKTTYL